jgi:NTE family protein
MSETSIPTPVLERSGDGLAIGLALGGGAARGLAHIVVLEVFDELGLRPAMIAGASMGAMVGAAYAAGMPAAAIREHALSVLGRPMSVARKLLRGGEARPRNLLNFSLTRGMMLDGAALIDLFMPQGLPRRLEDLPIPLLVSATDFYAAEERVITSGPLREALAASIAIPGLIAAPKIGGRLLVDGAIINPVPFDHLQAAGCRPVIAVEVTGHPSGLRRGGRKPGQTELALGATQIMQLKIAELKRRLSPPELWVDPPLNAYRAYDFLKSREILERADSMRDDIRRRLVALIEGAGRVIPLPPPA